MNSEQFRQLRQTFEEILATPDRERGILLSELAAADPAQAGELERMMRAGSEPTSLLDQPLHRQDAPSPGSQLGPYTLEKELGRGGMGIVYLGTRADGAFHKFVAVKILRVDRSGELFVSRFRRERQILAQMDHPHIAAILDAGTTPTGEPYFVMEYVDGIPITTYCEVQALSVSQKLDLFLQVCDAVQHAHRNLTVHRDLKPSNILVTEQGAVKLLDFGIAKLLEGDSGKAETAAILTPEYASPEQIRSEPVTTAADVFSLGILLYELIAGKHPFRRQDASSFDVMQAICDADPAPPGAGELDSIILTALRKKADWRYSSVEQFAEDIVRYRQGCPVQAKGNRLAYRLRKFARRQWLPLTSAALLVLLLCGGIVVTLREAAIAQRARQDAESSRMQADQERVKAETARVAAEQAGRLADEQRAIAEQRAFQIEQSRRREQEQYLQVRALASSMLFDLDDGIRDLAGSATARRLIVGKAQQQLELLSKQDNGDLDLQRDLAASYERLGELRVDPRHPDKAATATALDAYQHGLQIRTKIAAARPAAEREQIELALSLAKLGDGWLFSGDVKQAASLYQQAWDLAERQKHQDAAAVRRALGRIDERRCVVDVTAGGNAAACAEGIALVSGLVAAAPDDVELQRIMASTEASYANRLRIAGQFPDATAHARNAIGTLNHMTSLAPTNAEFRRMAAAAETILAQSLAASKDDAGSAAAFRRAAKAMEAAIEVDPGDLGSALRLAVTLRGFSRRLVAAGDQQGARDTMRQALDLLERTAEKPGAGAVEKNEYADALLKAEWLEMRQPAKALALAEGAVASTSRRNPFFLDTLAWAYFETGNAQKASDTEREALKLLPAGSTGGLAAELEKGLQTFLAGEPPRGKF